MIKAILFDMDGLILNTEVLYDQAMKKAGKLLGYSLDNKFLDSTRGVNNDSFTSMVCEEFGTDFPLELFRTAYHLLLEEQVQKQGIEIKDGFRLLLSYLDKNKISYALATSSNRRLTEYFLSCAGLDNIFSVIICGDEVPAGKPNPYIYQRAANHLATAPENCMVLEDSENGICAGYAAGCFTVMIPDMVWPSSSVVRKCSCILNSLREVPKLIDSLQETNCY